MGGQGLDIHVKDERAVLYWYTFTDGGERDWYYASFNREDSGFLLFRVEGGTFEHPEAGTSEIVGNGRFTMTGEKSALFYYADDVHGRNAMPLELLATTNHPHDGLYWNPKRNLEGFALRFAVNRCFGYWYYHKKGPQWVLLDGQAGPDGYDLTMYSAQGVFNRYALNDDYMTEIGPATLKPLPTGEWRFSCADLTTDIRRLF